MLFSIVPGDPGVQLVRPSFLPSSTGASRRYFRRRGLYITFSVSITECHGNPPPGERAGFEGQHRAIDSLLNYETCEILQQ